MDTKHRDSGLFILSIFLLFYLFSSVYCFEIHNITQNQALSQVNTLLSPSRVFELGFFTPNQSSSQYVGIWYVGISPRTIVWVANRDHPLKLTETQATLSIGSDGNVEILDGNKSSVWSTNVQVPSNSSVAVLLDNGNFVLKDGKSEVEMWRSFDHPGDTMLPGSVLGFNTLTKERYVLNSWKSENDPSRGNFTAEISSQVPPQAYVWRNGSIPYWRSGPWDKAKFTGIPDMDTDYRNDFTVVEDHDKGTTFLRFNSYVDFITNLFLSPDGFLKMKIEDQNDELVYYWQAPQNVCSVYGVCGPFGMCNHLKAPICTCLKGFVPKSIQEWNNGNWAQGCVRRKELLCGNITTDPSLKKGKTDGFGKIDHAKPPDFYEFVKATADFCRTSCMENCSCLAYTHVEGIGCLVWSQALVDVQIFSSGGAELYVRLSHEELAVEGHTVRNIIISIAAILGSAIIGAVAFFLYRSRATQKENIVEPTRNDDSVEQSDNARDSFQLSKQQDPNEPPVIDFRTILTATNQFSLANKLGQGGFGSVYQGIMPDGTEVAVKRLSSSSGQGAEEFKNEMTLISKLQHRNLVRVLGYSIEKEEKLLVYEFMPNKSLDCFIFDKRRNAQLNWASRFNIIHGIARGLVYLHRDSLLRVIHRDLKVSNILLDEKMNPKISDFGLARIFQGTLDLTSTQRVVGTLGYMAPEYAMGGMFSEKSDVFSFGVLLLEIVSGKKNTNFHYRDQHLSIISYAWELWNENRQLELLDEALLDSFSDSEVIRCIHIGLLCVQDYASDRPSMPDVVLMLSNETARPEPKEPIFALQTPPRYDSPSQTSKVSLNEATMSLVQGR